MSPLEQLEWFTRLAHIEQAAGMALEFVEGRTLSEYQTNALLRSGAERQLTIVGEALSYALKADSKLAGRITDAPQIVGLRNRLMHDYPLIDDELIWRIVHEHVPLLLAEPPRSLLAEAGQNPP